MYWLQVGELDDATKARNKKAAYVSTALTNNSDKSTTSRLIKITHQPELALELVRNFLTKEKVDVYKVTCDNSRPAGVQVDFIAHGSTMTRLEFYVQYIAWCATTVLNMPSEYSFGKMPSLDLLRASMDRFRDFDKKEVLLMLKQHIFNLKHCKGDTLTYYAKDGRVAKSAMTRNFNLDVLSKCANLTEVGKRDLIPQLQSMDGMSYNQAWIYSGGTSMAGHHVEDAFLKFVHVIFDIKWDQVPWDWDLCIQPSKGCSVAGKLALEVLMLINTYGIKSWLMGSITASAKGITSYCDMLSHEFGLEHTNNEHTLYHRGCILNPSYFSQKYPDIFKEVLLEPGDALLSNEAHSVVGFCSLSVAYNVLFREDIADLLWLEKDMATWMKAKTSSIVRCVRESRGRGDLINLSLASSLLTLCDKQWSIRNDVSYMGLIMYNAHKDMCDRLWYTVCMPSFDYLKGLYMDGCTHIDLRKICDESCPPKGPGIVKCMGLADARLLDSIHENQVQKQINTANIVCYVCGIPCLMHAVVCLTLKSVGRKRATSTPILCMECFEACMPFPDVVKEAYLLLVRSDFEMFFKEYHK